VNTPIVESRRTILACIALAGAVAIALLSLASAARGGDAKAQGAKTDALYPHSIKLTDGTQNDVLVLSRIDLSPTSSWYWVRLPILPNNTTGFVRKRDLSPLFTVHTHLFINRGALTATLQRYGKVIFKTRVGVGKSYWPTPRGEFYVRDKLTNFNNPFYGPLAFGISARSAVLTDWPGGGYVGIHGTNEPQLIPGYISHGCIRMRNASILALSRLMPVGTPVSIR